MLKGVEPRIIPRKEHHMSRKQVSPNALTTLYRLHRRGFIAYLVGGCVRDLLLGRTPKDFDIGTNATPGQIKRLFRNCRLIGRRFRLAHLHFDDEIIEVSTFRRTGALSDNPEPEETDSGHARRPRHIKDEEGMVLVDNVFGTPEEDALRRDFTVNALAYNIADASVIDFSTGLSDLKERLIRPIGDPRVRFTEDPVRMLRAVRFAASHNFNIEADAWESICELSSTVSRVSPARIYEEIQKLFLVGSARPAFSLMEKSGLLAALFPSLGRWIYGDNSRLAFLESNLAYLDQLYLDGTSPSPSLFFAALFGPSLEKAILARHLEGIPRPQALDETCAAFMEEISRTVSVPGRIGNRLRAILSLQVSLHRMPPRRPAAIAGRQEFGEALMYLRIAADTVKEHQAVLEWWDAYLLESPPAAPSEASADKVPGRRRRKRKRKSRRAPRNASRREDGSGSLEAEGEEATKAAPVGS
jgi:poly(A) polymerase